MMVQALVGCLDHRRQVQANGVLADDADDAEVGTAQRAGIAGAGRLFADGAEAGELIELVGQRNDERDRRGG